MRVGSQVNTIGFIWQSYKFALIRYVGPVHRIVARDDVPFGVPFGRLAGMANSRFNPLPTFTIVSRVSLATEPKVSLETAVVRVACIRRHSLHSTD